MRLITRCELAGKSVNELRGLLRHAFNELAKAAPCSHEHRNALASIDNIQKELSNRSLQHNPKKPFNNIQL